MNDHLTLEETRVPSPPLPFTLTAGTTGLRTALKNIRARGWILLVVVAVPTVVSAFNGRLVAGLLSGLAFAGLIALILLAVLGALWLTRNSSVTVTHAELIVHRVRRRVLQRDQLQEVLVGAFSNSTTPEPAPQVSFVSREQKLFAVLDTTNWPLDGLDELLAALGQQARFATREDRRLSPFWASRAFITALLCVLVVVLIIVATVIART